jgi:hypothetical protein
MITLDGRAYEQQAPEMIAGEMVARINKACADNNIKNKDGETVYLEINSASVFYQMMLSQAYQDSVLQSLILATAAELSFAECSTEKLLEWAKIMRIKRRVASNTSVNVNIEADTADASITPNNTSTLLIGGKKVVFRPAYEDTVKAGTSKNIIFLCDETGPVEVTNGAISEFDEPVPNVKKVSSAPGMAGRKEETLDELRWRMGMERFNGSDVELAQNAISQLAGISFCAIHVNYSVVNDMNIAGLIVPPRHSIVFIQGYSPYIADEYYNYMNMPTVYIEKNDRFVLQEKTTLAGQKIPMYFVIPRIQEVWVRVVLKEPVTETIREKVRDIILSVNSTYGISENITSAQLQDKMDKEGPDYGTLGVQVADNNAGVWGVSTNVYGDSIPLIQRDNITVEQFTTE